MIAVLCVGLLGLMLAIAAIAVGVYRATRS
jgi:hypothetical protein